MRSVRLLAGMAICLAGCFTPREERLRDYNADGVHLYEHGAYEEAAQTFEAALTLKPNDAGLLYDMGECCQRRCVFDQAERYYKECLEQDPNHVPCHFALASLLVQMGRSADAERMIQAWLTKAPKQADPYALDGWFSHQAGDLPRAQARLHQALDIDPHNQRALIELALLYEAMNRPARAVVLYERVLDQEPNQPEVKARLKELNDKGAGRPLPD